MIDLFLQAYPASAPRIEFDDDFRDEIGNALPKQLHELYEQVGLGKLKEGMFELIDPRIYADSYADFFGGDAGRRTPFMLNAFGEPIAYKHIGPREAEISILHTYGPKIEVLAYDIGDFFDRIMLTDDGLLDVINISLYGQLKGRLKTLRPREVYGFNPAVLSEEEEGNKVDASYFEVVDALAHLKLLLGLAS